VEIFYQNEILSPLSTKYVGDDDLLFRTKRKSTQENFFYFSEPYLKSTIDQKINNYSNLVLTNNLKNSDIFRINDIPYTQQLIFASTLKLKNKKFLKYNSDNTLGFASASNRYTSFEIQILTDNTLLILYRLGFEVFYLTCDGTNFYFSNDFNYAKIVFYFLKNKNTFYLYKKIGSIFKIITPTATGISLSDDLINYKKYPFYLNFYIQELAADLNTSWCSYNTLYKNSLLIDASKSSNNLTNNTLVYSNYTYITGDSIDANFLTLKNQNTLKNYSYRADCLTNNNPKVPNVGMRNYTSLNTGNNQELGSDSITFTYEIYNTDYVFKADHLTKFKTPDSLYPFNQLNINDSQFLKAGSIAGANPYFADKIFFRDLRDGKSDGKYICTWLSAAGDNAVWVDRYYLPEQYSDASAYSVEPAIVYTDKLLNYLETPLASADYYDNFNWHTTPASEALFTPQTIKDAIWGEYFFDKKSDLILLPEAEYVYQRIGEEYVSRLLNGLSAALISDGLSGFKRNDGFEYSFEEPIDDIIYEFNGKEYNLIEEYRKVNENNEFTLSFTMNSDNWSNGFGHSVMGSYNDRGFGVFSDEKITPFIMVQNGRSVNILNTNFDIIDTVYLTQNELDLKSITKVIETTTDSTSTTYITGFFIKDVVRTDHLDFFAPTVSKYNDTIENSELLSIKSGCGILYADEEEFTRALSPDNVVQHSTTIRKIQLEQCYISTLVKIRS
jgi:hypothetical protein